MDMQDKEFDELFRSRLENFETEPSGNAWPGILDGLNTATRSRGRAAWFSIAASILLLAGISAIFMVKSSHPRMGAGRTAVATQPTKQKVNAVPSSVKPAVAVALHKFAAAKPTSAHKSTVTQSVIPVQIVKPLDTVNAVTALLKKDGPLFIADIPQTKPAPVKAVVPDVSTQFSVKSAISQLPGTQQVAGNLADKPKDTLSVKHKHKIHTFGDLVNLVVDKVDKRRDKVLEFTDDGDGDSNLTGVNLGVLKIKKGE